MAGVAASGTPALAGLMSSASEALDEALLFSREVDTLSIGGNLDAATRQLDLDAKLTLRGRRSWFSRALTAKIVPAGKAPSILWDAPREASLTLHGQGLEPGMVEPPRRFLQRVASVVLPRSGDPQDARAVDAFLAATPAFDAPWVLARLPAPGAGKSPAPHGDVFAQAQQALARASGTLVLGVEQPAATHAAWLRRSAALLQQINRPSKPGSERAEVLDALLADGHPAVHLDASPAGYPRGSVVAEFSMPAGGTDVVELLQSLSPGASPGSAPKKKGKLSVFVAVAADGAGRSWIGLGFDPVTLRSALQASLAGAPADGKLGARTDLGDLHGPGASWGGMLQPGPLLEEALSGLGAASGSIDSTVRMAFSLMPNRLATPLVLLGAGAHDEHPALSFDIRLSKGTFEDISTLAPVLPAISRLLKP
jgi:hypothetical protein